MSDAGRQSFTGKAAAAPDSQKTFTEQMSDSIKGTYDSIASTIQPQSEKSYGQQATDAMSGNSNEDQDSLAERAKKAFGSE